MDKADRLDGDLLYRPTCGAVIITTIIALIWSVSFDKLVTVWAFITIVYMCMAGRLSPSAGMIWWPSQRTNRLNSRATLIRTGVFAAAFVLLIYRLMAVYPGCAITSCPVPLPCPVASRAVALLPTSSASGGESSHRRLAIVFPFIASQAERLFGGLESWRTFRPCQAKDGHPASGAQISVVLYFDKDLDTAAAMSDGRTIKQYFLDGWQTLPEQTRSCVTGGIQFVSAKLRDEENLHPDGPCIQQFKLHKLLPAQYDHFFQMEPDVAPIQDFWMDALINESNDNDGCGRWWMKGSMSRCDGRFGFIANRHDFHLNGNALYCLGNGQFVDYLNRIQTFYPAGHVTGRVSPGCSTGAWGEDGWDHTMFQYRQQSVNFDYIKNVNWKFMDAPFISNLCEDEYNVRDILKQSSKRTFLVHSKFPFLAADEQWLRRTFLAVMGRYSTPQDRVLYKPRNEERMDHAAVIDTLCNHDERSRYVSSLSNEEELSVTDPSGNGADTAHARPSARARATAVCNDDGRAKLLANADAPPMLPPGKTDDNDDASTTSNGGNDDTTPGGVTASPSSTRRHQRLTRQRPPSPTKLASTTATPNGNANNDASVRGDIDIVTQPAASIR